MRKRVRKFIVLFLVLSIIFTSLDKMEGRAVENKQRCFNGDGFDVTYTVSDSWEDGYNVCVEIRNTGEEKIENWSLSFEHTEQIINMWNAAIQSDLNGYYTIKNQQWNQDIPKGESVSFGFSVSGKFEGFPEEYFLNGSVKEMDETDYAVEYHMSDCWQDGFNGVIEITNRSEQPIEEWALSFSLKDSIRQIWNAEMITNDNNNYVVKGCSYNQNIKPGETVSFGFLCSGTGDEEPQNFILSAFDPGEDESGSEDIPEEESEDELNEKTVCDYVNIDLKTGNTWRSVIDDITFLNYAPEEIHVLWDISEPEVISPQGKVTRREQDTQVKITANIEYDGKFFSKEFDLTVIAANKWNKNEIKDLSISDLKSMNAEDEDFEMERNHFGYLQNVSGKFSDIKVDSYESALCSLYSIRSLMGITDPFSELRPYHTKSDDAGHIFKFSQTYKGVPVYGNQVVVSADTEGNIDSLVSDYFPVDENVDLEPVLSYEQAADKIKEKYSDIEIEGEDGNFYILNYYGKCDLVWEVPFVSHSDSDGLTESEYVALVGTREGEIKFCGETSCALFDKRLPASGQDLLDSIRLFYVKKKVNLLPPGKYVLEDTKRNIEIYDAKGKEFPNGEKIEKKKSDWTPTEVSAMANISETYDYYKNKLGRISYDDALFPFTGNTIEVYVNTDTKDNTFWNPAEKVIDLGTGTGTRYLKRSLGAGLDILGHEFTHAVVMYETEMEKLYYGTTGAINEGYADIIACYVDGNWQVGEDVTIGLPIRNIENPLKTYNPKKFGGRYFMDYKDYRNVENDNGGNHNNSTLISHLAYQMQTETFKDKRIDELWYESLCLGYSKYTDFYDVRKNVLKAAKRLKYTKAERKKIKQLFDDACITKKNCNETYKSYFKDADKYAGYSGAYFAAQGSCGGKVVKADSDMEKSNNAALEDVDIRWMDKNQETLLGKTFTDEDGEYEISAEPQDVYCAEFSKQGYLDEMMYVTGANASSQSEYSCDTVELISKEDEGNGTASGKVKDASHPDGKPGLMLRLRKGINNLYTDVIKTLYTDDEGKYRTGELPAGNYCVEIVDEENGSDFFNIKILGGREIAEQDRESRGNQWRIVLTWGEKPADLDALLSAMFLDREYFYLTYFVEKAAHPELGDVFQKDEKRAGIDKDVRDSFGPETTTIYNLEEGGYYFFSVRNFEEDSRSSLSLSGAMVRVYRGNSTKPVYTTKVPEGEGFYWNAFCIMGDTGEILPINTITDEVLSGFGL